MRFPRFTIRRMMIVVAVGALLLTSYRLIGVSLYRRRTALMCALAERDAIAEVARLERTVAVSGNPKLTEDARVRAAYFAAMRKKHEDAARYPWLSVEPDPPEPE